MGTLLESKEKSPKEIPFHSTNQTLIHQAYRSPWIPRLCSQPLGSFTATPPLGYKVTPCQIHWFYVSLCKCMLDMNVTSGGIANLSVCLYKLRVLLRKASISSLLPFVPLFSQEIQKHLGRARISQFVLPLRSLSSASFHLP